jgi:hypothetical protein
VKSRKVLVRSAAGCYRSSRGLQCLEDICFGWLLKTACRREPFYLPDDPIESQIRFTRAVVTCDSRSRERSSVLMGQARLRMTARLR